MGDFHTKAKKLGARVGDLKKSNKEKTVLQYLMKKKGCTFGTAASKVDKSDYEKRCPSGANNEEAKPEPEPEQATDDPGPEPEEEIVDPEEVVDPEDTTEDTSSSEADKCCVFTFEQWDCSNQHKQDGCKKALDAIEDFDTKAKKLGARVGDLKKGNKEKTVLKYLMRKKGCAFGPAASVVEKSVYEKRCPNGASYE